MRDRYKIILLFLICFVIYLPSVQTGYFVLDDIPLVKNIMRDPWTPLARVFQHDSGTYYRPMVELSYILEARFWAMKPSFMHLVNIIIHAVNGILVFVIARRLTIDRTEIKSVAPVLAAAVFIVHPINTESINWISGRADPLATVFVLIATYLLILALHKQLQVFVWLAALSLLGGSLAKEIAFAMIPGIILTLLFIKPDKSKLLQSEPGRIWRLSACLPLILTGLCYGYLRSSSYTKVDLGAGMVVDSVIAAPSPWLKMEAMITAFGFYLKKLLIPFPQNFAINTINPLYFWVGIMSIVLLMIILIRRNFNAAIILFTVLPITPALLVAVIEFAFLPPYAERYLYLSSAFFVIVLCMQSVNTRTSRRVFLAILWIILVMYLPATVQRNFLWTDHLRLLESIDVQNLEHASFWNAYCIVLADRGLYNKARSEYKKLIRKHPDDQTAYTNWARMELFVEDPVAAHMVMEPFTMGKVKPKKNTLIAMQDVNQALVESDKGHSSNLVIQEELLATRLKLYELTSNPNYLLSAAETALKIENYSQAEELANRLVSEYGNDDIIMSGVTRIYSVINSYDQ